MLSIPNHKTSRLPLWAIVPPAVYLFVLPFAHTISIRWIALGLGVIAATRYYSIASIPKIPCIVPIGLWLLVTTMSLARADNFSYSLSEFRVDVLYALAGFLVLFTLSESVREFRILLWSILVGACVISAIGVLGYLQHDHWVDGYQNYLGEFSSCILMAIAVIPLVATEKIKRKRNLLAVAFALAIIVAAGACTRSRMFWVSMVSMFFVAGIMYAWEKPNKVRIAVVLSLLFISVIGTAGFIFAAARPGLDADNKDPRLAIWDQAIQNISEKPFSGAGFGREVYKDRYEKIVPGRGLYHAHNIFLSYAEQMGIQGTVALIIIFVALLLEFVRIWNANDLLMKNIGIAGTALVIGVIVKSTTDTHFGREVTLYFWAILGLLLGVGRRRENALRND